MTAQQNLNLRTARPGFSFIELAVAILILGILAATVGPKVMSWLKRSKLTATEATLRAVKSQLDIYREDVGQYPASLEDLVVKPAQVPANQWHGPYVGTEKGVDEVPKDGWKNELGYNLKPKGSVPPFELYSYGPNGESSDPSEWIHA